ncbi:MAG: EAL domain-containing protein [Pseudomonadota bacterium]|nr:EAL domain-containing protein [Pseudomonadota bacterium]
MPDSLSLNNEALVQFLYRAPIGLVQIESSGEVALMNPRSAQLLMPLAPQADLHNLFDVLQSVAPQLRGLAAAATQPGDVVCEGLRLTLPPAPAAATTGAEGDESEPLTIELNLLRLDADSLMASLNDVTLAVRNEQQRLVTQLRDVARIDSLTRLPNRVVALERIACALERARCDPGYEFAVLYMNCDRFTSVNLNLGQRAGDALLQLMAARINGTVRHRDTANRDSSEGRIAARVGGDEFVLVLEALRHADDATGIAQRLIDALQRPYELGAQSVHVGASIGVVTREHAGASADAVLQDASLAMREAKRAGGARLCLFEAPIKERAQQRSTVERDLRLALATGQLFVVYQPIVRLQTPTPDANAKPEADATGARPWVEGFEALVRWRHPVRGVVPPTEFIEVAEQTGLIGSLGEFVLTEACRQFARWRHDLGVRAPQTLSVNLSRAQLQDVGIVHQVQRALNASALAPHHLQLEVTESMAAQDLLVQTRLHALKALGLTLALDDFGTGYSSLACLHQLPIDVVKIDRSFVCQAESSAHHRVLIEATVRVARSLQMQTVAEGIETAGQAAILSALACDKGQGYFYARPMPADEVGPWLRGAGPQTPALPTSLAQRSVGVAADLLSTAA